MLCRQYKSIAVRVVCINLFQDQQPLKLPNKKKIPLSFCPLLPLWKGNPIQTCFILLQDQKAKDDTSTPDVPEWRNLPVIKALTQKNSDGKIICPFTACGKQYVDDAQFGKHLVRDHMKELSIFDTEKIGKDIASVSSQASKSPSASMSSLKTGSGGAKKKIFYYFSRTN